MRAHDPGKIVLERYLLIEKRRRMVRQAMIQQRSDRTIWHIEFNHGEVDVTPRHT